MLNYYFNDRYGLACIDEIRRAFKVGFWLFDSRRTRLDKQDFIHTYNMGQEL